MGVLASDSASELLLGRYRLQKLIGHGGMASVYQARDERLSRDVAVKIFQASATDQTDIDRQEDEMRVLASLNHRSLVTLLDAGMDLTDPAEPHIYLVMELVEGADLRHRLSQGPLSARQTALIGYDLAEGLEYIHRRGVVHRDIKPANILMVEYSDDDTRPGAKLSDFGIALLVESEYLTDETEPMIGEGTSFGTAAYLSPEQARGDAGGPPCDIYSLGLVLLECFTGKKAFPGQPLQSALARLVSDPVVPGDLAPEWRELLSAMTARKPGDRPLIHDIVLALRQAVAAETGRHRFVDAAILPANEEARMRAVHRYQLLDTPPDIAFDRITALAAHEFAVPIALVSVVDHDRIWFKSHHGLEIEQIDRIAGFSASAILHDAPWIIENARLDPRAQAHPLVAGELGPRFYAGVPLRTLDGYNLGTLCVMGFDPRVVTAQEIVTLQNFAAMVMSELELRLESRHSNRKMTA